mgnify:CR=1 FL=1
MLKPKISIIVPSFNDNRIKNTIDSIIRFDDINSVEMVIVDGGSDNKVLMSLRSSIRENDILISEQDRGIFDALNKGLELSRGNIIGWLGSDDFFSKDLKASYVIKNIANYDLFILGAAHFGNGNIKRITPAWPQKYGLIKFGFNNPHFSTFGKRDILLSENFDEDNWAADIDYFLKIFDKKPQVNTSKKIGSYMSEGGFSSRSASFIFLNNLKLITTYTKYNRLFGYFSPFIKLIFKILTRLPFLITTKNHKIKYE